MNALAGPELRRARFAFSGENGWDWNVHLDGSGNLLRYNVHFKDGRLLGTSTSLELRNKRSPRG